MRAVDWALAGQVATVALIAVVALRFAWARGFLRGFRRGRETTAETVRVLSRMEEPAAGAVRGSYLRRRTPITYPIPVDPDHDSHVDRA